MEFRRGEKVMRAADDHGAGFREVSAASETGQGRLSQEAWSQLAETVLAHIEDAVVLSVVEEITDGAWSSVVAHVNPGFTALTGYGAAEVLGKSAEMWAPTEINRTVHDEFRRGLEAGHPVRGDESVVTSIGAVRRTDTSIRPVSDDNGVRYLITTMRDITDRTRQTLDLAEEADRLHEAQAIANVGSWVWDVSGDVVTWSDELFRIYGLDRAEFGATFEAYLAQIHADDRDLARQNVENALRSHEPFIGDYRLVRPDGEIRWLHSRGRAILDAEGSVAELVGTCQDVTDQRAAEDRLRHRALHDDLTGLPTRTLLFDRLEHAMSRAARHGLTLVLLFADLDHFKMVNDRYGHAAGDETLVAIASRLRTALRPGDTVARFGGDEFVALCEEVDGEQQAAALGQRIVDAVTEAGRSLIIGLRLSASVGIVMSDGGTPADVLLRNADAAMYRAKQHGAGRTELFR